MTQWASGSTIIRITKEQNDFVKLLVREKFAENSQQVIELALALGLRSGARRPIEGANHDAAKVGQLDPEGVLEIAIMEAFGSLTEEARVRAVMESIAAGLEALEESFRESGNTLDVGALIAQ